MNFRPIGSRQVNQALDLVGKLIDKKQCVKAEEILLEIISQNEGCSMAHARLGECHRLRGKLAYAKKEFKRSIGIRISGYALSRLAITYKCQGKRDKAVKYMKNALDHGMKDSLTLRYAKELGLSRKIDVERSLPETFVITTPSQKETASQDVMSSSKADPYYMSGMKLLAQNSPREALQKFEQGLEIDGNHLLCEMAKLFALMRLSKKAGDTQKWLFFTRTLDDLYKTVTAQASLKALSLEEEMLFKMGTDYIEIFEKQVSLRDARDIKNRSHTLCDVFSEKFPFNLKKHVLKALILTILENKYEEGVEIYYQIINLFDSSLASLLKGASVTALTHLNETESFLFFDSVKNRISLLLELLKSNEAIILRTLDSHLKKKKEFENYQIAVYLHQLNPSDLTIYHLLYKQTITNLRLEEASLYKEKILSENKDYFLSLLTIEMRVLFKKEKFEKELLEGILYLSKLPDKEKFALHVFNHFTTVHLNVLVRLLRVLSFETGLDVLNLCIYLKKYDIARLIFKSIDTDADKIDILKDCAEMLFPTGKKYLESIYEKNQKDSSTFPNVDLYFLSGKELLKTPHEALELFGKGLEINPSHFYCNAYMFFVSSIILNDAKEYEQLLIANSAFEAWYKSSLCQNEGDDIVKIKSLYLIIQNYYNILFFKSRQPNAQTTVNYLREKLVDLKSIVEKSLSDTFFAHLFRGHEFCIHKDYPSSIHQYHQALAKLSETIESLFCQTETIVTRKSFHKYLKISALGSLLESNEQLLKAVKNDFNHVQISKITKYSYEVAKEIQALNDSHEQSLFCLYRYYMLFMHDYASATVCKEKLIALNSSYLPYVLYKEVEHLIIPTVQIKEDFFRALIILSNYPHLFDESLINKVEYAILIEGFEDKVMQYLIGASLDSHINVLYAIVCAKQPVTAMKIYKRIEAQFLDLSNIDEVKFDKCVKFLNSHYATNP